MAVTIHLEGVEEALALLAAGQRAFEKPLAPILRTIGETVLVEALRENLATEGTRLGVSWPGHAQGTVKIREHYGHTGPMLQRTQPDLLHSLAVQQVTDDAVEVGSALPYAEILHTGGPWSGGKVYNPRTLPAREYLGVTEQDVSDAQEIALTEILAELQ